VSHHRPDISESEPIVARTGVTSDQYFGMAPANQPQNVIDGLLYLSPPPSDEHEEIVAVLYEALRAYAREHGGHALRPRSDCVIDGSNIVQPDTGYLVPERANLAGRYIHGAPDLVVEVFGPGTRAFDTQAKFELYGKSGVREAWFVDYELRSVTVISGSGEAWTAEQTVNFGQLIPSALVQIGAAGLGQV
jgi:Uma2 family endonuclease